MTKKKESIKDRIAEAVEMELAQAKTIGWSEEGKRLDDELDFDKQDFSLIEDNED